MKTFLAFFSMVVLFMAIANCSRNKDELKALEKEKLKLEIENLKLDNQIKKDSIQNLKKP